MAFAIATPVVPAAVRGQAFVLNFTTTGSPVGEVTWAVAAGVTLPPGFDFSAIAAQLACPLGVLPTCPEGTYSITIEATDETPETEDVTFDVVVTRTLGQSNAAVSARQLGII